MINLKTTALSRLPCPGDLRARSPSFEFVGGRPSKMEFQASVDGFNNLDNWLTDRLGAPVQTVRHGVRFSHGPTFSRVRRHWRKAGVDAWLIDPSRHPEELTVRYGALGLGLSSPQNKPN